MRVVLGNEAMDLDSMAASMVWAYWLTHVGVADRLVIPVMNVPRAEMKLRKDNLVALAKAGRWCKPELLDLGITPGFVCVD